MQYRQDAFIRVPVAKSKDDDDGNMLSQDLDINRLRSYPQRGHRVCPHVAIHDNIRNPRKDPIERSISHVVPIIAQLTTLLRSQECLEIPHHHPQCQELESHRKTLNYPSSQSNRNSQDDVLYETKRTSRRNEIDGTFRNQLAFLHTERFIVNQTHYSSRQIQQSSSESIPMKSTIPHDRAEEVVNYNSSGDTLPIRKKRPAHNCDPPCRKASSSNTRTNEIIQQTRFQKGV